jgi:septum site-determining protein MinD
VVTNPEVSSVRDSDRVLGLLASKTQRAEKGLEPVKSQVLLTRHDQGRIDRGEMMAVEDVLELLAVPLLGIVPESTAVLRASNVGMPVVLDAPSSAASAYEDAVARLLGEDVPMRIGSDKRPGLLGRFFGRSA